jgi:cytochrome c-type biogenesis protein CcmE
MNLSATITTGVALLAIGGGTWAMLSGATPYMTLKQARAAHVDRMNLEGDVLKGSVRGDLEHHTTTFVLRDHDGAQIRVHYTGEPINWSIATRVVAIGALEGDEFKSDKVLTKCPSKYDGQKPAYPAAGSKPGDGAA